MEASARRYWPKPRRSPVQRGAELLEINVDGEDTDARRFYERHGYANTEPGQDEPMLYYYRELTSPAP